MRRNRFIPLAIAAALIVALTAITAPARASVVLTITSTNHYWSSSYLYIAGSVQNNGSSIAQFVEVSFQFYDASNRLLDTDFTYTHLDRLAPGERGGFRNIVDPPDGYHHYTASVTGSATTRTVNRNFTTTITNTFTDGAGYQHIVGTVRNNNTTTSEFVQVNFQFNDGSGRTVDADFTFVDTDSSASIPPGGTATFELYRASHQPSYSSYVVTADSITAPSTPPPPPPSGGGGTSGGGRSGYWMLGEKGSVYAFGDARHSGNAPVGSFTAQDIEATSDFNGYWVVDNAGHVYTFGNARYFGGASGLPPGEQVTSISRTWDSNGYWLFTSAGRAFAYGSAQHYGDMRGVRLNGPVLDSVSLSIGNGYYMVASDGGVFSFGHAAFHGSMGGHRLNQPVQSLVPDGDGAGYWLVASDGGVFAFSAPFRGSMGSARLNRPIVGMVRYGDGYLMVGADGGIFNFSNKPFVGSLGSSPPAVPITSVAVVNG